MKKVETKKEKYVTEKKFNSFEKNFEGSMRSIAQSFDKMNEKFDEKFKKNDGVLELILKEIRDGNAERRNHRLEMTSLNHNDVSQERDIEDLKVRVERLEMKR